MSPTVFRQGPYRFYFFSREEVRMHVHVQASQGEAKFWIEPKIELAENYGLKARQLTATLRLVKNMKTKSAKPGKHTFAVEVANISPHGFWLLIGHTEHFLSFEKFPWFRDATIGQLTNVELPSPHHLFWPELDIDVAVDAITNPERYPLVSTKTKNPANSASKRNSRK